MPYKNRDEYRRYMRKYMAQQRSEFKVLRDAMKKIQNETDIKKIRKLINEALK